EPIPQPKIPDNDYTYPCDTVPARYSHACFQYLPEYQNILFTQNGITDIHDRLSKGLATCESLSAIQRSQCFEGFGRYMTSQDFAIYPSQTDSGTPECMALKTDTDRKSCLMGRIFNLSNYALTGSAGALCSYIDTEYRQFCFNAFFQFSEFAGISDLSPL